MAGVFAQDLWYCIGFKCETRSISKLILCCKTLKKIFSSPTFWSGWKKARFPLLGVVDDDGGGGGVGMRTAHLIESAALWLDFSKTCCDVSKRTKCYLLGTATASSTTMVYDEEERESRKNLIATKGSFLSIEQFYNPEVT